MAEKSVEKEPWVSFEEVAVYFTKEEWDLLDLGQQALYKEVMLEIYWNMACLELAAMESPAPGPDSEAPPPLPEISGDMKPFIEKEEFGNQRELRRNRENHSSASQLGIMEVQRVPYRIEYWRSREVSLLLNSLSQQARAAQRVMRSTNRRNFQYFSRASQLLYQNGFARAASQCRTKFKALKAKFFEAMETSNGAPSAANRPPFFEKMKALWISAGRPSWKERRPPGARRKRREKESSSSSSEAEAGDIPQREPQHHKLAAMEATALGTATEAPPPPPEIWNLILGRLDRMERQLSALEEAQRVQGP